MNIYTHFSWYVPEMELLGHRVIAAQLWHALQIAYQSSCASFHIHQQCMRVPVLLLPHQRWYYQVWFCLGPTLGAQCYLIVVLTCIALMTDEVE